MAVAIQYYSRNDWNDLIASYCNGQLSHIKMSLKFKEAESFYDCPKDISQLLQSCAAKSLQSCPTLFDSMACSPPGSSMGFSSQEYWSGLPFPPLGDLLNLEIEPTSFTSPALAVGEGNGTPLQYSCLENPMNGGAWQAAVHGVAKSRTRLSNFTFTFHFPALEKEMQPTPVFLPGESQGQGSLVGCRLWGRTEWTRLR